MAGRLVAFMARSPWKLGKLTVQTRVHPAYMLLMHTNVGNEKALFSKRGKHLPRGGAICDCGRTRLYLARIPEKRVGLIYSRASHREELWLEILLV